MKTALFLPVVLALFAGPAQAQVHRCKDENGKTYYSDRGCVGGGERVRGAPGGAGHTIGTAAGDEDVARKCLEYVRGREGLGPAGSVRVEGYRVKTVAVRDVGARRLFTINVAFVNAMGYWAAGAQYDCLLRGDNVTFQTTPYEIVN